MTSRLLGQGVPVNWRRIRPIATQRRTATPTSDPQACGIRAARTRSKFRARNTKGLAFLDADSVERTQRGAAGPRAFLTSKLSGSAAGSCT